MFVVWIIAVGAVAGAQHAVRPVAFAEAESGARKFKLVPGLKLDVWAAEPQLSNSVAFCFDGRGRVFLAESDRWAISVFDITAHTNWLMEDMSFRDVGDRAVFLAREFATNLTLLTKDSEVVRMIEDRTGDGRADHSTIVADGFHSMVEGTAAGVLATPDRIYFANIPSLWALKVPSTTLSSADTGGASPASRGHLAPEKLASGFGVHIGVSGHDLHGLIKGHDGRIYMSFGDRGCVLTNREGVVIRLPDTGGVLRCEPDGRNLEVFCHGLRNPQELAFDDLGNLWTVDNDTAGADPCRVLHLVEGADYGWRTSYQHMDGFGPWVQEDLWKGGQDGILPPAGTVSQGPSGLAYYPGTGFGNRLAGAFLHCDFPGGVTSFTVKPQGASYVVDRKERFLWNCWPTDVDFGPDGAAYVLDWVSGWGQTPRGRIYRITPNDVGADVDRVGSKPDSNGASSLHRPREAELISEVKRLLAEGMTERKEPELLALLGHPDRRVRLEAQWEMASRGSGSVPALVGVARIKENRMARLHALWALGQVVRKFPTTQGTADLAQLLELLEDDDPEIRGQAALLVLGEGRLINAERPVRDLLADSSARVRCMAVQAFAQRLDSTVSGSFPADEMAAMILRDPADPFIHQAVDRFLCTYTHRTGAFTNLFVESDSPLLRGSALLAWRQQTNAGVVRFLTDPDPSLVVAAGRAIHDVPIVEGFPALASFITKIDCPTNLYSRVIDACFRLGTQQHAQMLAGFAAREDVPDWARVLAVKALGDWEKPPPLDRVNGLWRPLVTAREEEGRMDQSLLTSPPTGAANPLLDRAARASSSRNLGRASELPVLPADLGRSASYAEAMALRRNPAPAKRAYLRVAGDIMNPFNLTEAGLPAGTREVLSLQVAAVEAAAKLRVKEAGNPLYEKFSDPKTPPELRRAIVVALAGLNSPWGRDAVAAALSDADSRVRVAALPFLDRLDGADASTVLAALVPGKPGEWRLAQAALLQLGRRVAAADTNAAAALRRIANEASRSGIPDELLLDLREARRSLPLDNLDDRTNLTEIYSMCLTGGDAARGRDVFLNNPTVQCLRCHKVSGDGGTVGPDLTGIGKRQDRRYLLESLVAPNARIAPGFESVVLTLKDGSSLAGILKRESGDVLEMDVADPDTGEVRLQTVSKSSVDSRQSGLSAMPEGLAGQLSPFDVRDLVEYLSGLK